jgi:pimeloyl-ACP methyl ester carboxylesterase
MSVPKNPRLLAAAAGLSAAAGAAAVVQRRLRERIASDPDQEALRDPPFGRPTSVTSRDGTTLHVESFGPEAGQTVVLIHGWTEEIRFWLHVIRELSAQGLRVLAYDLRGHGHSGRALHGDYSLARFGEDVEAVLEACMPDGERAVVAGHSLGAMSIVAWAEHHEVQRHAGAAVLMNTGVGNLIAEQLLVPLPKIARAANEIVARRGFLGSRATLPRFSTPLTHAAIKYVAFGRAATPAQVAFYERMLITLPPDVRADVGIAMSEMRLYDALPSLTVPTLVIAGEDDRLTPPSHAERIARSVPRLHELVVLEKAGHMGPLECPELISDAVTRLARRVSSSAAAVTR